MRKTISIFLLVIISLCFVIGCTSSAPTLKSISVTTEPSKTEYVAGDKLDLTGMVVTATYSDGKTSEISKGKYTTVPDEGSELSEVGIKEIVVSYENQSTSFMVTISQPTVYTVSFDSQGGSDVASQQVVDGRTAKEPEDPVKTDYKFDGWYKDSEYTGTKYDFNTPVTADLTLYAKWNPSVAKQKWCVMSYFDFSDLEATALYNLDEICQTKSNENVKAYFLTGGAAKDYNIHAYPYLSKAILPFNESNPFNASAKADTYQFWEYTSDGKFKELSCQVKGMNDSNILIQFMENCISMAKASDPNADFKYILELWNHGGGSYSGLIRDYAIRQTSNEDVLMSLSDCAEAINSVAKSNNIRFEVVIFDMCLMQSIETAYAVSAEFTNYIIGSETSSAGIGSAYIDWFNFLYNNPTASGKEFGICFCDAAYQKVVDYGHEPFIKNITWSVLDMSKFKGVVDAYDAYVASNLIQLPAQDVEKCLEEIEKIPAFASDFWSNYMYDINAFTSNIGGSEEGRTLMEAINNAIVYKKNGSLQESGNVCGLSMCVLTNASNWKEWNFSSEWNNAYLTNCLTDNYRVFQKRITTGL